MILVPRYFWMALHRETEARSGIEANEAPLLAEYCGVAFRRTAAPTPS